MKTLSIPSVRLNNKVAIPILGLGVFESAPGRETQQAVEWALEAGYRHIDTAALYGNERDVYHAIKSSGINRQEIFITTKLWNDDQGYESTFRAFQKSLKNLGRTYIDLYLMHWPVLATRKQSWKAMEEIWAEGECRAIGVSNFLIHHLEELFTYANVIPAVNQVEFHPYNNQKNLLEFCLKYTIQLEAYAPLVKGLKMKDPILVNIARHHHKTPAQVLIRWVIQQHIVAIPKSVHKARIIENADVFDFELTSDEMEILGNLDQNLHTSWNPETQP